MFELSGTNNNLTIPIEDSFNESAENLANPNGLDFDLILSDYARDPYSETTAPTHSDIRTDDDTDQENIINTAESLNYIRQDDHFVSPEFPHFTQPFPLEHPPPQQVNSISEPTITKIKDDLIPEGPAYHDNLIENSKDNQFIMASATISAAPRIHQENISPPEVNFETTIVNDPQVEQNHIENSAVPSTSTVPAPFATNTQTSAFDTTRVATTVTVPTHEPGWMENINHRIQWLTSQHIKSANIDLIPNELGPIRAEIQVHQGITTITLHAQQPEIRDTIEQNLAQLKQLFDESGMDPPQVSVADEPFPQQDSQHPPSSYHGASPNHHQTPAVFESPPTNTPNTLILESMGLIDYYA